MKKTTALFAFFLLLVFTLPVVAGDRSQLSVNFLNVKNGNAIFIQTPAGKNVLIDSGDGTDGLLAWMKAKSIKRIDYAVISSPDVKNIGGFSELISGGLDIGEFYAPEADDAPSAFESLLEEIMSMQDKLASSGDKESAIRDALNNIKHFEFQNVSTGTLLPWDQNMSVAIIGPYMKYKNTKANLDNNSLVLKLTYGAHSFLFTGNIKTEACRDLTKLGSKIQSTVLQIPSNGAGAIDVPTFYQRVAPKNSVAQTGAKGVVANEIKTVLKTQGSVVLLTSEKGAVQISTDGIALNVKTEK